MIHAGQVKAHYCSLYIHRIEARQVSPVVLCGYTPARSPFSPQRPTKVHFHARQLCLCSYCRPRYSRSQVAGQRTDKKTRSYRTSDRPRLTTRSVRAPA